MNEIDNSVIVVNNEEITFKYFMERLLELKRDCNHEHYLSEIFIPFFRMCCDDDTKIIPVFDDRKSGPRTDKQTEDKDKQTKVEERMQMICAPIADGSNGEPDSKEDKKYVVPDYIFVSNSYTFENPQKPLLMVETKNPALTVKEKNGKMYYRGLSELIGENEPELLAEIQACEYVIFTDGITWMFLKEENEKIVEAEEYPKISLVQSYEKYYKMERIEIKENIQIIDLSFIGGVRGEIKTAPDEWEKLKRQIKKLIEQLKNEK